MQRYSPEKGIFTAVYVFLLAAMALTGLSQMPISKRYYIAEIPGLGWTADFYLTHYLHYIGAIALLTFVSYCVSSYLVVERHRFELTLAGYVRGILLAAVMITGIFRVLKNLPRVVFSPGFTMFIDVSHVTFMVLFFLAACLFLVRGSGWVRAKRRPPSPLKGLESEST